MSKLRALMVYQFKLQMRDFTNVFFVIAFPMLMYIFFSNILEGQVSYDGSFNATEFLLPAYIPIVIANTVLLVFGHMLISHKERNYFIKYKLMGYRPMQVAGTLFISVMIIQVIGILALVTTAIVTKGATVPLGNLGNILVILLIINIFQFTLTFFLGSIISRGSLYQSVALIIFYFQMFLGGMTFPPEMFPEKIRLVSEIFNPIIHGLYVLREVWIVGRGVWEFPLQLGILLGTSTVFFIIATKMFKWSDLHQ